jgi:hypothetical protein
MTVEPAAPEQENEYHNNQYERHRLIPQSTDTTIKQARGDVQSDPDRQLHGHPLFSRLSPAQKGN